MGVKVTAAEVQRDFSTYHDLALVEPVEVTRPDAKAVVIVSAERFNEMRRSERRVIRVEDLTDDEIELIAKAEIPAEHRYSINDLK